MCEVTVIFTATELILGNVEEKCERCVYTKLLNKNLQKYSEDSCKNLLYFKTSYFSREDFVISKRKLIRRLITQVTELSPCTTNFFLTSYLLKGLGLEDIELFKKECSILLYENVEKLFFAHCDDEKLIFAHCSNLSMLHKGIVHFISQRI